MPSPEADALLLLEAALGVDRSTLLLQPDRPLDPAARARLAEMLRRRVAREPLQHILGWAPFYGLELAVSPSVLIPRPETERLVELVLSALRQRPEGAGAPVVLDVGCGSGAIALSVKAEWPSAEVWGGDSSAEAVALSRRNATELGLEVTFRLSDLLADPDVAAVAARSDVLVANLPYLPEGDRDQLPPEVRADPASALFGGIDGLAVANRLVWQAEQLMPKGALLALELDPRNARQMLANLRAWRSASLGSDLTGRTRFVLAQR